MKSTRVESLQVSCIQMHWAEALASNLTKTLHYIEAAAASGSRVVVFPEANLTSYYFPYLVTLNPEDIDEALENVCSTAARCGVWVIVGTIRKTVRHYLNRAHVISPAGVIVHEYAKIHLAGVDEQKYCRGGEKLSLFKIDGISCTLAICRDGRHPEVYRIPAMAGAQLLFQPSCSTDDAKAVVWKRSSGRAQQPVGPTTSIFHCVANTWGQSPDGRQLSGGSSFIRDPNGLPLAEAGCYREEMITAVLDLSQADRRYALDSMNTPPFLRKYWKMMIADLKAGCNAVMNNLSVCEARPGAETILQP